MGAIRKKHIGFDNMNKYNTQKVIEILLVDDNPGDVRLTIEALKGGRILNHISVAPDGVEALAFLRREGIYVNSPKPDLILLDLNMPRKDGREVLNEIKNDPVLKIIPVIVLTTSEAEQDILKTYMFHANCFITKPIEVEEFFRVIRTLEDLWLSLIKLPSG
jgi:chemotaxis family two-component system response regulator Rcp1